MSAARLLAVFAHPDDESFGVGGTLAKYAASGTAITVVTATRGERSTIGRSEQYSPEALAALRETELRHAAAALGVADVRVLGYPDGGLQELPAGQLAADVAAVIAELRPAVVLTFDLGGVTGHPDHVAVAVATTAAFVAAAREGGPLAAPWHARLYYWTLPASLATRVEAATGTRWVSSPDDAIALAVDTGAYLAVQREAIACHRSQCDSAPPPPLTARLAAQQGHEYFLLAQSTLPGDRVSGEDLLAGLAVLRR